MVDRLRRSLAERSDIRRQASLRRQGLSPAVQPDLAWRDARRPDDEPDELDRIIAS